jgi:hypothetical protein
MTRVFKPLACFLAAIQKCPDLREQAMMVNATIRDEDLECQLGVVRAAAAGPVAGIFGPHSLMWRIDREAVIFLGAGRALLL